MIKNEILAMMKMVWPVISDKWKAPNDKQEVFLGKQNVRAVPQRTIEGIWNSRLFET